MHFSTLEDPSECCPKDTAFKADHEGMLALMGLVLVLKDRESMLKGTHTVCVKWQFWPAVVPKLPQNLLPHCLYELYMY